MVNCAMLATICIVVLIALDRPSLNNAEAIECPCIGRTTLMGSKSHRWIGTNKDEWFSDLKANWATQFGEAFGKWIDEANDFWPGCNNSKCIIDKTPGSEGHNTWKQMEELQFKKWNLDVPKDAEAACVLAEFAPVFQEAADRVKQNSGLQFQSCAIKPADSNVWNQKPKPDATVKCKGASEERIWFVDDKQVDGAWGHSRFCVFNESEPMPVQTTTSKPGSATPATGTSASPATNQPSATPATGTSASQPNATMATSASGSAATTTPVSRGPTTASPETSPTKKPCSRATTSATTMTAAATTTMTAAPTTTSAANKSKDPSIAMAVSLIILVVAVKPILEAARKTGG